jgi:hypothetical protein
MGTVLNQRSLRIMLALAAIGLPVPVYAAGSVTTVQINPGAASCDGTNRDTFWSNSTGGLFTSRVSDCDMGLKADLLGTLYRGSDSMILISEAWDHYAEPTGHHTTTVSFAPDYIVLTNGDYLSFHYKCTAFAGTSGNHHQTIHVWYTTTP